MDSIHARFILHVLLTIASLFFLTAHAGNDSSIRIKWGYKGNIGPERWAQLDPGFLICAQGKLQSPISIEKNIVSIKDGLKIYYSSAPLVIVNDGQTQLTIAKEQITIADGHSIQINMTPRSNQKITYEGKPFQLVQLHIHTPSENLFQGRSFPMEIHFVHQGKNGEVVIIGVFAKGGLLNTELQKMIVHLPTEQHTPMTVTGETINPSQLLPKNLNYYSFQGSLTTPPCTEGVKWIVMFDPITVSPAQIARLREAVGGNNARPVQPLNGRTINAVTRQQQSLNNR